ncbi:MAG: signal peptidase I [Trueperaceae bacterium]
MAETDPVRNATPRDRARARLSGKGSGSAPAAPLTWQQRFWREVRGYAEALVIAYLVVTFVFTTVGVVGSSMEPNLNGGNGGTLIQSLLTGDRVFIPKFDTWLRRMGVLPAFERGAVVVLREPANAPTALATGSQKFFIKRIVAVPGDRVRIERGQVFVNGVAIDQGFITDEAPFRVAEVDFPKVLVENGRVSAMVVGFDRASASLSNPVLPMGGFDPAPNAVDDPLVQLFYGNVVSNVEVPSGTTEGTPVVLDLLLPDGYYFVMGDNRSARGSEDSRYFGPIRAITIAGRATAVIWPPRRDGEWNWRGLPAPEAFDLAP